MHIIFVDDDDDFRKCFTEILRNRGHEVHAFENPSICPLQMMPQCRCNENERCTDMIIVDLKMPVINGIQFIKTQKDKHCKCNYVVLISGNINEEDMLTVKSLGCHVFDKLLDIDDFLKWTDSITINPDRILRNWYKEPVK